MKFSILLTASLLMLLCGCSAPMTHGIPNFSMVEPGVYRGGQPTMEGWFYLRTELGVTNDVKLNVLSEGGDEDADALGMTVFTAPITLPMQLGLRPIPPDWIDNILAANGNRPGTFIHCEHGQDRTGLFVACYRVRWDGWTKDAAQQEMLALGFHPALKGLWDFWKQSPINSLGDKP
jgi:hypothetical protein